MTVAEGMGFPKSFVCDRTIFAQRSFVFSLVLSMAIYSNTVKVGTAQQSWLRNYKGSKEEAVSARAILELKKGTLESTRQQQAQPHTRIAKNRLVSFWVQTYSTLRH